MRTSVACQILLVLFCLFSMNRAAAEDSNGLLLHQTRLSEKLELLVAKDAVKAVMPDRHWTAIAKAPDWRVNTFNTNSKLRFDLSMEKWLEGGILDKSNDSIDVYFNRDKLKVRSSRTGSDGKYKLTRIVFKSFDEKIGRSYHGMGEVDYKLGIVNQPPESVEAYSCLYANELGSEKVNAFLYSFFSMPPSKGLPMEYITLLKGNKSMWRLKTLSMSPTKITTDSFQIPKGYKTGISAEQVFIALNQGAVFEMFEDLDVGTKFGSKKTDKKP